MYFVGIDLGGTVIKIGLVSDGKVLDTIRLEADSRNGLAARLDPMAGAVDELLARSGLSSASLGGIALAFPGIVDVRNARALGTNAKYDDAPGVDLKAWAGEHWNVGLAMDNDARMATVGEWLYGAGKGCGQMVMMTIGTGIGTGVVLDGRLLYGRNFCAGSPGGPHIHTRPHDRLGVRVTIAVLCEQCPEIPIVRILSEPGRHTVKFLNDPRQEE